MKQIIAILLFALFGTVILFGQKITQGLTMSYGAFDVSYSTEMPSGQTTLPLVLGKMSSGSKESFGIVLKSSEGKSSFVDIFDSKGKLLKSITVGDFLGRSNSNGVKLISSSLLGDRGMENLYAVAVSGSEVTLKMTALLAGEKDNANSPQQIIVTFALSSKTPMNVSLGINLPVDGSAVKKSGGVVLSGKGTQNAISIASLPAENIVDIKNKTISIKSPAASVGSETPVAWLLISGSASVSGAAAAMENSVKSLSLPSIVVVNTTSSPKAQPGDTVTYTLFCKNIGSGDATNVIVSNPIPAGTAYVDGSASNDNADVTFDKETVPAPQQGKVDQIHWKLLTPLKSGGVQSVLFKVIIQ